jgi:anti-sigma B factor antagonist
MESLGRASAPLAISENNEGHECRLVLSGELDLSNAEELRDRIQAVQTGGASRVVVDLSGLGFIDSTGLRILLRAEQESREDSGFLSFVPPQGQVERVMKLAGIDAELTFVE